MPILYSCLSRGSVILVDKSLGREDFQSVAKEILQDVSSYRNKKTSIPRDNYNYHTVVDSGFVYICVGDEDAGRRMPYNFLDELKQNFVASSSLVMRSESAAPFEFNREFRQVLADLMEKHNSGKGDNVTALQNQVHEVTGIMKQNVEKVLERGEKLDDLVDKTDDLQASSNTFKVTSRKISRKMFWRNRKMMIIIAVVSLVVITIIVLIILSSTGTI